MTPTEIDRFRDAVVAAAAEGRKLADGVMAGTVVLVEGASDRAAVETLAGRVGRDLAAEAVCVVPMGGVTSIRRFLDVLAGRGARVAGLCDAGEERFIRRGLAAAGLGEPATVPDLERLGFFVCERDLEDELIRALGSRTVEQIMDARGELALFRTFQNQPAQRERSIERQLHRFAGTRSGRKTEYAIAFVEALDLERVPRPLGLLLDRVAF